jgi:hypothetical protein
MLALQGTYSPADAYGVTSAPESSGKHLIIHLENQGGKAGAYGEPSVFAGTRERPRLGRHNHDQHLRGRRLGQRSLIRRGRHPRQLPVYGHPGVLGLWLNDVQRGRHNRRCRPPDELKTIDPATYEVTDLRPAANGWMFARGVTWEPGVGKRPYP